MMGWNIELWCILFFWIVSRILVEKKEVSFGENKAIFLVGTTDGSI